MADFEDANSPTWDNVRDGQRNVYDAVRRTIELDTGEKQYRLDDEIATLLIRPRGWHLVERHHEVDSKPISASLFDFGLVVFNNAHEAHAIGGMAAFIPSRRDPGINAVALTKVREDKQREAGDGFDGTWVAHPDLVPVATAEFDAVLGERPHQVERKRSDVDVSEVDLLDFDVPGG